MIPDGLPDLAEGWQLHARTIEARLNLLQCGLVACSLEAAAQHLQGLGGPVLDLDAAPRQGTCNPAQGGEDTHDQPPECPVAPALNLGDQIEEVGPVARRGNFSPCGRFGLAGQVAPCAVLGLDAEVPELFIGLPGPLRLGQYTEQLVVAVIEHAGLLRSVLERPDRSSPRVSPGDTPSKKRPGTRSYSWVLTSSRSLKSGHCPPPREQGQVRTAGGARGQQAREIRALARVWRLPCGCGRPHRSFGSYQTIPKGLFPSEGFDEQDGI